MAAIAPAITLDKLTKKYGGVAAVNGLSFTAQPGRVLGFLGPNGSGKTTTLRMLLGLARPSSGVALIGGRTYASYAQPMSVIGASLEANSFNPGRTGRNHLRVIAAAAGIDEGRVDYVLGMVGLTRDAKRAVKGYSLGMRQRLGLAAALLGDPGVLALDEPINGLDPEGIRWIRELLRQLAAEGRTILVSSHVLSEVAQTVDDVVIINRGHSVFSGGLADLERLAGSTVVVDSPTPESLARALQEAGRPVRAFGGVAAVDGATAAEIGHLAFVAGVELSQLSEQRASLEDVFVGIIHQSSQRLFGEPSPASGDAMGNIGGADGPEVNAAGLPESARHRRAVEPQPQPQSQPQSQPVAVEPAQPEPAPPVAPPPAGVDLAGPTKPGEGDAR